MQRRILAVVTPAHWRTDRWRPPHTARTADHQLTPAHTGAIGPGSSTLPAHRYRVTVQRKDENRRQGKGRSCCLGAELIQFLAAVAILHQDDLKKGMNSAYSSYCNSAYSSYCPGAIHPILQIVLVQIASTTKKLINSAPPSTSNNLCRYPFLRVAS